jgi:hypothetical protein
VWIAGSQLVEHAVDVGAIAPLPAPAGFVDPFADDDGRCGRQLALVDQRILGWVAVVPRRI